MTRHTATWTAGLALAAAATLAPSLATAAIPGITGTVASGARTFRLAARPDRISTGDGNSLLVWGFSDGARRAQYPGPTLLVSEGDLVTVELANHLPTPVSIHFPGHDVRATGGAPGVLVQEAPAASGGVPGTVTYRFTAARPGTFLYQSGTRPDVQVEMGLFGALIVRPRGFDPAQPRAYGHADSRYDREFLFVHSEMDPRIHRMVELQGPAALDQTGLLADYFSNYWFHNGRTAPDTMAPAALPLLPTQPYDSFPRFHAGERILMRVVGAGRELHPFHHHGNHARVIARNGQLLESAPGAGADLAPEVFTIQVVPGQTVDALFEWTGAGLGWDVYGAGNGHACTDGDGDGFDDVTREWCQDHGTPIPVALPDVTTLTLGGFWSGSPFLGGAEPLPPGQGGLNPNGGLTFMWHSHREKELTNFGIFPGGAMTMIVIEPSWVEIPEPPGRM